MHPIRIARLIEKRRFHEEQVDAVRQLYQGLGRPGVAGVHHRSATGSVLLDANGVRLHRVSDANGADGKRPDPLAGLPDPPVEMLGHRWAMLSDRAGAIWNLICLGDPQSSVGWAVNRAARPRGAWRVARSNVVAAEVKAVVGMQMAQRHGIQLTRVEVAVEGTHRAGTE